MTELVFLGLDIGGSGCKCAAFNESGAQLCAAYSDYGQSDGQTELSPFVLREKVFSVIADCVNSIPPESGKIRKLVSVSLASFGEAFVLLDRSDSPLSPIVMYIDNAAQRESELLAAELGSDEIIRRTTVAPDAMYTVPKLRKAFLDASVRERTKKVVLAGSYIGYLLCGVSAASFDLAGTTMAFDPSVCEWDELITASAGISPKMLPEAVPAGTCIGKISEAAARVLPLGTEVKVYACLHDQMAAALGTGSVYPGSAVNTTGTVECVSPVFNPVKDKISFAKLNYRTFRFPLRHKEELYATNAYTLCGGASLQWFCNIFAAAEKAEAKKSGMNVYALLDNLSDGARHDLYFIPHFLGAGGTPEKNTTTKAQIHGMTFETRLADIYSSLLEGISFEMRHNFDVLARFGIEPDCLRCAGGGAKSAVWLQMKADIWNKPIASVGVSEAGAAGVAMLAAIGERIYKTPEEAVSGFVHPGRVFEPETRNIAYYNEKYEKYMKLRAHVMKTAT